MSGGFRKGHTAAAKITAVDAAEIYRLWNEEGWSQARIARHYHMSETQIGRICRGTSWQQVPRTTHHAVVEQSQAMLDAVAPESFELSPDFLAELSAVQHVVTAAQMPVDPSVAARAAAYGAKSKPAIQAQPVQDAQQGATDGSAAPERGVSDDPLDQSTEESAK